MIAVSETTRPNDIATAMIRHSALGLKLTARYRPTQVVRMRETYSGNEKRAKVDHITLQPSHANSARRACVRRSRNHPVGIR